MLRNTAGVRQKSSTILQLDGGNKSWMAILR